MTEGHYNVKAVCRLTGLNEHTLRSWERRYQAITPERQENRRRLYTREDVERLRLLVRLVEYGYAIGQVGLLKDLELRNLVTQHEAINLSDVRQGETDPISQGTDLASSKNQAILKALETFDLGLMQIELEHARLEHGSKDLIMKIFLPLMSQVGQLVFHAKMDIAQEHALTALIRSHLLDIFFQTRRLRSYRRNNQPENLKKSIIVSTPEGDIHEIGILAASILCADAALDVTYIGPNMPANPLGKVAKLLNVDVVMIGLSPLPPGTTPQSASEYLVELTSNLPDACELWLGGMLPSKAELTLIKNTVRCFKSMGDLEAALKAMG